MGRKQESKMVVGLDIGTSKVLAIVAEVNASNELEIIGVGQHPAKGLRRGVVADIEATVNSIKQAVEDAELMANSSIFSVNVGIAGAHIHSLNSTGVVRIKDGEVSHDDIERVIEASQAVNIPKDQKVLHVLPQEYIVDEQEEVTKPLAMSGVRLEARVHIITGAESSVQNIVKCVKRCGLEVDDIILEQLASSEAVLTPDERELGVCMIDIGGGTTDIAVFQGKTIQHTAVIPIAGDQVTNDIAMVIQTPTEAANDLKIKYGCALASQVGEEETIQAPSMGGKPSRSLSRYQLAQVIESRMEEIYSLVRGELEAQRVDHLVGAVVITGGSSKIEHAVELAEEVFDLPVRLGMPQYQGGLQETVQNPIFATGIGLVKWGHRRLNEPARKTRKKGKLVSVLERMKSWFKGSF